MALEALQETLWRLLIDAPRSLSLPPQAAVVGAGAGRRCAGHRSLEGAPGGRPSPRWPLPLTRSAASRASMSTAATRRPGWPRRDTAAFDTWRDTATTLPARALALLAATAPGLCRSDTALMPGLDDDAWWSAVVPALQRDPLFAQAPTWGGDPVETGALVAAAGAAAGGGADRARRPQRGHALCRAPGRSWPGCCGSCRWPLTMRRAGCAPGPWATGVGLAAVQTARGLLLHHARLAEGRVTDYRIVAPTEWNFHPQGALFRGIVGTEAPDEADAGRARGLAVHALDPCVGFRIEVARDA